VKSGCIGIPNPQSDQVDASLLHRQEHILGFTLADLPQSAALANGWQEGYIHPAQHGVNLSLWLWISPAPAGFRQYKQYEEGQTDAHHSKH
jgi:hypothetical protein